MELSGSECRFIEKEVDEDVPSEKQERRVSLSTMLKNKAVWAIITANVVNHWGYFMYLNWMPTYFYKVLGMNLRTSSFMSFVPWLVMAFGSVTSGYVCDYLVSSGVNRTAIRKLIQSIALLGPVPALIALSTGSLTAGQALIAMTFALGLTSVGQFTANISEVAPGMQVACLVFLIHLVVSLVSQESR